MLLSDLLLGRLQRPCGEPQSRRADVRLILAHGAGGRRGGDGGHHLADLDRHADQVGPAVTATRSRDAGSAISGG